MVRHADFRIWKAVTSGETGEEVSRACGPGRGMLSSQFWDARCLLVSLGEQLISAPVDIVIHW